MKVQGGVLNSYGFVVIMAELIKTKICKQLDLRSKTDEECGWYVETLGSMRARSTWSSDGLSTDIFLNDD